jgi:hypothetical protein
MDQEDIQEVKQIEKPKTPTLNELIVLMNTSEKKERNDVDLGDLNNSFIKTPFCINNDIFGLEQNTGMYKLMVVYSFQ